MLYYEIYDNNSSHWVVFLHGFGGSTLTWKKQIEAFSDYNLLLMDLPGHGNSTNENLISITGVSICIKEVLDHLNIRRADFVALSLGTLVLTNFAIRYPDYVNSIIYGGASLKLNGIYKRLLAVVNMTKEALPSRFLFTTLSKIMLPRKNHQTSRKIFIRESMKMKRKSVLLWVSYVWNVLGKRNLWRGLKELNIEMLFVSGSEDICFIDGTKEVVNNLSQANLSVIENCGHVCTIEKYREFNKTALEFLNRIHAEEEVVYA